MGPRKLLLPKNVAKKRCKIYDKNATESPLLRLPPEIRTRIWGYVLGGNTIHIERHGMRETIYHSLCRLDQSPEEEAAALQKVNNPMSHDYRQRHKSCLDFSTQGQLTLSLSCLKACRQIHQEAALLFYQENIFAFSTLRSLDFFPRKLIPAQSRVIRSICVVGGMGRTWGAPTSGILDRKLPSLDQLVVFVEFNGIKDNLDFITSPRFREQCASTWLHLSHLPITSLRVVTSRQVETLFETRAGITMIEAWTKEIEEKLMAPYDKGAILKRRDEKRIKGEQQAEQERERKRQNRAGGRLRALKY